MAQRRNVSNEELRQPILLTNVYDQRNIQIPVLCYPLQKLEFDILNPGLRKRPSQAIAFVMLFVGVSMPSVGKILVFLKKAIFDDDKTHLSLKSENFDQLDKVLIGLALLSLLLLFIKTNVPHSKYKLIQDIQKHFDDRADEIQ